MKRKLIIHDKIDNKTIEKEFTVRDLEHLAIQIRFPAQTIRPKKGAGSYSRKEKHRTTELV